MPIKWDIAIDIEAANAQQDREERKISHYNQHPTPHPNHRSDSQERQTQTRDPYTPDKTPAHSPVSPFQGNTPKTPSSSTGTPTTTPRGKRKRRLSRSFSMDQKSLLTPTPPKAKSGVKLTGLMLSKMLSMHKYYYRTATNFQYAGVLVLRESKGKSSFTAAQFKTPEDYKPGHKCPHIFDSYQDLKLVTKDGLPLLVGKGVYTGKQGKRIELEVVAQNIVPYVRMFKGEKTLEYVCFMQPGRLSQLKLSSQPKATVVNPKLHSKLVQTDKHKVISEYFKEELSKEEVSEAKILAEKHNQHRKGIEQWVKINPDEVAFRKSLKRRNPTQKQIFDDQSARDNLDDNNQVFGAILNEKYRIEFDKMLFAPHKSKRSVEEMHEHCMTRLHDLEDHIGEAFSEQLTPIIAKLEEAMSLDDKSDNIDQREKALKQAKQLISRQYYPEYLHAIAHSTMPKGYYNPEGKPYPQVKENLGIGASYVNTAMMPFERTQGFFAMNACGEIISETRCLFVCLFDSHIIDVIIFEQRDTVVDTGEVYYSQQHHRITSEAPLFWRAQEIGLLTFARLSQYRHEAETNYAVDDQRAQASLDLAQYKCMQSKTDSKSNPTLKRTRKVVIVENEGIEPKVKLSSMSEEELLKHSQYAKNVKLSSHKQPKKSSNKQVIKFVYNTRSKQKDRLNKTKIEVLTKSAKPDQSTATKPLRRSKRVQQIKK